MGKVEHNTATDAAVDTEALDAWVKDQVAVSKDNVTDMPAAMEGVHVAVDDHVPGSKVASVAVGLRCAKGYHGGRCFSVRRAREEGLEEEAPQEEGFEEEQEELKKKEMENEYDEDEDNDGEEEEFF